MWSSTGFYRCFNDSKACTICGKLGVMEEKRVETSFAHIQPGLFCCVLCARFLVCVMSLGRKFSVDFNLLGGILLMTLISIHISRREKLKKQHGKIQFSQDFFVFLLCLCPRYSYFFEKLKIPLKALSKAFDRPRLSGWRRVCTRSERTNERREEGGTSNVG